MFALDVSENRIRILEVLKKGKRLSVNAFGEKEFEKKEELPLLLQALARATRPHGIISREVGLAIPEEESFTKIVQLPQKEPEELKALLSEEVEKILPYGQKDVYWDWKVIGNALTEDAHLDIIFVASPKSVVDFYSSAIQKAGFEPALIETEPNALLWGALNPFRPHDLIPPTLVVDIGVSKVTIVIFSKGAIRFTSSIKLDMSSATPPDYLAMEWNDWVNTRKEEWSAMQKTLQELAKKLAEYIDYYEEHLVHSHEKNNQSLEDIIVCGAWANFPELLDYLAKKMKKRVRGPEKMFSLHPAYTTALGIALRGIYEEYYV